MTEQPADHSASAPRTPTLPRTPTAPQTPSAQQTVRWTTPPTDGGERLDGRSVALVSADRVLTGRRGQAEGSLEVLGGADDAGARAAGRGGAILVRGREILAAGTAAELEGRLSELVPDVDPRKVARLDLPGATLMPGLIETHDHLPTSGTDVEYPDYGPHEVARLTLNAARSARELLSEGVTSVQSLGARHYVDVALRDAVDAGGLRGPRIVASGPQITTTGGHAHHAGGAADSVDEIRRQVRRHHLMGVDTIKAMATGGFTTGGSAPWFAQFTVEELRVMFDEAHRLGKWTAAHAHGVQGIERAVRAGVDYIAHASFVSAAGRTEFDPRLADEMANAGVYVDCTIVAALPGFIASDPSYAPPARLLWEHGVRIVAGHDAGIPGSPQRAYVGGLQALEEVGLPRNEVLLAATSRAAAGIGRAGVTGVLAAGFEADFIAVAGDPRQDLAVLHNLRLVAARGREFRPDRVEGLPARETPAEPIGPAATLAEWRERSARLARHPEV